MNTTTTPGPVMEALGSIAYYALKMKPLLPTYLHLIVSAVFPIYTAAHASLRRPVSAAPAKKKKSGKASRDESDSDDDSSSPIETLTASDAILFPVLAGLTLTGLYLLIKWLEDPKLLNKILGYYFSWVGLFFCFKFIKETLYFTRSWVFPMQFSLNGKLYKINEKENRFVAAETGESSREAAQNDLSDKKPSGLLGWIRNTYMGVRRTAHQGLTCSLTIRKPLGPLRLSFLTTWLDVIAGLSAIFVASHTALGFKTPWYLTNLQGFAFCYGSLQYMSPGTSAVGSLLLALLFCYDIYMVFYTPMMVTVATKLDVPIKLLFPKNVEAERAMAMLGLGDIVVPGIMIAFALRFDLYRHYAKMSKGTNMNAVQTDDKKEKDNRPTYNSVRGSWAERTYTSKRLWSPSLTAKEFPKPYFTATVIGYILGMVATVVIMTVFEHAQPALLYLVPGVLLSFWGTALIKREVKLAWGFDEALEEKEKERKENEKEKEEKQKAKDAETKDDKSNEKDKSQIPKKTAEEKDVEDGLKPVISLNVYFRRVPSSSSEAASTSEGKSATTNENVSSEVSDKSAALDGNSSHAEESTSDNHDTKLETSASSSTSSTSSAEIVSQEEAFEAANNGQADDSAEVMKDSEKEIDIEGVGDDESVLVSTRDDDGGARAIKRRRRG